MIVKALNSGFAALDFRCNVVNYNSFYFAVFRFSNFLQSCFWNLVH